MDDDDKIALAFREFHRQNPQVYDEIVKLARRLKERGWQRYGIKALYEVVRFHRAIETTDETFKLNNNFTALYARLIMEQEPEFASFFETRIREPKFRLDHRFGGPYGGLARPAE